MQNLKSNIKNRLFQALRNKFENYKPETSSMPFHARLLGKDRMALLPLSKVLIQTLAQVSLLKKLRLALF